MGTLREWMISLSAACIAAGIIRLAAGGKSKTAVINLVSVLYILLSVFRSGVSIPTFSDDWAEAFSETSGAPAAVDAGELALRQAEETLEAQFAEECARRGFEARLTLELTEENGECRLNSASVTADSEHVTAARQLAEEWFGEAAGAELGKGEGE